MDEVGEELWRMFKRAPRILKVIWIASIIFTILVASLSIIALIKYVVT